MPGYFKPFRVDFIKEPGDETRQAKEILDEALRLHDGFVGAGQQPPPIGITYSANLKQKTDLNAAGNDPLQLAPANAITGLNQAAVMSEVTRLLNTDAKYQPLQGIFKILPIATMQYDAQNAAHALDTTQPTQNPLNDVANINRFIQNNGIVLGWQNQNTKNGYAVGGGVTQNLPQADRAIAQNYLQQTQQGLANTAQNNPPPAQEVQHENNRRVQLDKIIADKDAAEQKKQQEDDEQRKRDEAKERWERSATFREEYRQKQGDTGLGWKESDEAKQDRDPNGPALAADEAKKLKTAVYKNTAIKQFNLDVEVDEKNDTVSVVPIPRKVDFETAWSETMDFMVLNTGTDTIKFSWPGINEDVLNLKSNKEEVWTLLKLAEQKGVAIEFDKNVMSFAKKNFSKEEFDKFEESIEKLKENRDKKTAILAVNQDNDFKNLTNGIKNEKKLTEYEKNIPLQNNPLLDDPVKKQAREDGFKQALYGVNPNDPQPDAATKLKAIEKELEKLDQRMERIDGAQKKLDDHVAACGKILAKPEDFSRSKIPGLKSKFQRFKDLFKKKDTIERDDVTVSKADVLEKVQEAHQAATASKNALKQAAELERKDIDECRRILVTELQTLQNALPAVGGRNDQQREQAVKIVELTDKTNDQGTKLTQMENDLKVDPNNPSPSETRWNKMTTDLQTKAQAERDLQAGNAPLPK